MVNQYKQQIDGVMQREVSRSEFLKFVGIALLGLIGIAGFLKNLHEIVPSQIADKKQPVPSGYGQSAYGR